MKFSPTFFKGCLGKSTILYGESNTGKTYYTAEFIKFLLETKKTSQDSITILDFAPKKEIIADKKIGGKIRSFYNKSKTCKYYSVKGEIIPARLMAENKEELYKYKCHNLKLCHTLLEQYTNNPTPFLVINDISIYLHLNKVKTLLKYIRLADTFFGNSYYGTGIKSDFSRILSILEKKRVEKLISYMDTSRHLTEKLENT
ncbi:MAG: hypothetical protein R6U96_17275 [Promethearchaeia archaeon]